MCQGKSRLNANGLLSLIFLGRKAKINLKPSLFNLLDPRKQFLRLIILEGDSRWISVKWFNNLQCLLKSTFKPVDGLKMIADIFQASDDVNLSI